MLAVFLRLVVGAAITAVVLAIISAIAVSTILLPRLDTMLADAMRRELSLPADATVLIQRGSLKQTIRGFLPRSLVESTSAVIDDVPVENLRFKTKDIDFNMRRIVRGEKAEITAVGAAELSLRISADELRSRLTAAIEKQGLKNVQVEFGTDSVKVTAENDAQAELSATGRFYLVANNRVGFALTEVKLDMVNIEVSNLVLPVDDVLPDLDLGGMFAKVVIDQIKVTSTYMEITAHAEDIGSGQAPEESVEMF